MNAAVKQQAIKLVLHVSFNVSFGDCNLFPESKTKSQGNLSISKEAFLTYFWFDFHILV